MTWSGPDKSVCFEVITSSVLQSVWAIKTLTDQGHVPIRSPSMRMNRPSSLHGRVNIVALLCLCSLKALIAVMLACCKAELRLWYRGVLSGSFPSLLGQKRGGSVYRCRTRLWDHGCVWNEILAYYILCSVHYILHTSFFLIALSHGLIMVVTTLSCYLFSSEMEGWVESFALWDTVFLIITLQLILDFVVGHPCILCL